MDQAGLQYMQRRKKMPILKDNFKLQKENGKRNTIWEGKISQ